MYFLNKGFLKKHIKTKKQKVNKMPDNVEQENKAITENISKIKNKFIILSGKGGVGKTTFSVNLARFLAEKGYKTGLLDIDIHGPNVNKMLGLGTQGFTGSGGRISPLIAHKNLKVASTASILQNPDTPIIWRGPLKMKLIKQFLSEVDWGELDFLIIDSPPGTGDEPLSAIQLIEDLRGAIIITTPQEVSILDARKSIIFAKTLNVAFIGLVENLSGLICPHCHKEIELFGTGLAEKTAEELGVDFLGKLPMDPGVVKLSDSGKTFITDKEKSPIAKAFVQIGEKIISKSLL